MITLILSCAYLAVAVWMFVKSSELKSWRRYAVSLLWPMVLAISVSMLWQIATQKKELKQMKQTIIARLQETDSGLTLDEIEEVYKGSNRDTDRPRSMLAAKQLIEDGTLAKTTTEEGKTKVYLASKLPGA